MSDETNELFVLAKKLYVEDEMSLRQVSLELRSRGFRFRNSKLFYWLKSQGVVRTPTETLVLLRKSGKRSMSCIIPGCDRKCRGRRKYCDECIPDGIAHTTFLRQGITQPQVDSLFEKQRGLCRGCKCELVKRGSKSESRLHIDHDHKTGLIRGLLCHACNTAIGYARDNPSILRSLANYLEEQSQKGRRPGDLETV